MDPGTPPSDDATKDEGVSRETRREKLAGIVAAAGRLQAGGLGARLRGELDVHDLDALRAFLSIVADSDRPVFVDLSGVTFLDLGWARELAASHLQSPGLLVLCSPSWQAAASFAACGP